MSITNELNQIKNAIYGREVRGAIHDAIKECYDDASVNHDNANMEVKIARGTHATLNDRLNKTDENQLQTNAQLSFVAQDIYSKLHSSDMFLPQKRGVDMQMGGFFTNDMLKATLLKLKEMTISDICLCPYLGTDDTTSSNINRISTLDEIEDILSFANNNDIPIKCVKVHFSKASSLNPIDVDAFLNNYQSILLDTLNVCVAYGVEYYGVANELSKITNKCYEKWRQIIDSLKNQGVKVFTSCTYDEKDTSVILGLVDIIGVNFYPNLSDKGTDATVKECQMNLYGKSYIRALRELKEKYRKPLWLTELGCVRSSQALSQPSNSNLETDEEGNRVQGVFFESLLPIIGSSLYNDNALIDGVFIWNCSNINPPDKFNFIGNVFAEPTILKYYSMKGDE